MIPYPEILLVALRSAGLAFALSLLLSPGILALLRRMKAKQTIHSQAPEAHQAKQGTPNMGGLIILAGLLPALIIDGRQTGPGVFYIAALVGAFALIGFVDDFVVPRIRPGARGLGWLPKLAMQAGAASLAAPALGFSWNPMVWACVIFFILAFANAYNFLDGLDSLAGSVGVVFALGLAAITVIVQPLANLVPLFALVGALIPFLLVNAPPARVFMGDMGSLPIGALLGLMSLAPLRTVILDSFDPVGRALEIMPQMVIPSAQLVLPIAILCFVLIAELLPPPMQVAYFKLTKGKRLFPMTPIHHGFEKKGWPESRVVWSFVWVQVFCAGLALYLTLINVPVSK